MTEKRKIPKLLLAMSLFTLWWTVSVFLEDGPFNNYATRLSEFEAKYGVDSSQIDGCWGERGGEWVNICASRSEDAGSAWIIPLVFFLFFSIWTVLKYLDSSNKFPASDNPEPPSATES